MLELIFYYIWWIACILLLIYIIIIILDLICRWIKQLSKKIKIFFIITYKLKKMTTEEKIISGDLYQSLMWDKTKIEKYYKRIINN